VNTYFSADMSWPYLCDIFLKLIIKAFKLGSEKEETRLLQIQVNHLRAILTCYRPPSILRWKFRIFRKCGL